MSLEQTIQDKLKEFMEQIGYMIDLKVPGISLIAQFKNTEFACPMINLENNRVEYIQSVIAFVREAKKETNDNSDNYQSLNFIHRIDSPALESSLLANAPEGTTAEETPRSSPACTKDRFFSKGSVSSTREPIKVTDKDADKIPVSSASIQDRGPKPGILQRRANFYMLPKSVPLVSDSTPPSQPSLPFS